MLQFYHWNKYQYFSDIYKEYAQKYKEFLYYEEKLGKFMFGDLKYANKK